MTTLILMLGLTSLTSGFSLWGCEYTKDGMKDCALKKCDFDQDGRVSKLEVDYIFNNVLVGFARSAALTFTSPEIAIEHCGDETGFITMDSFEASEICARWCMAKRMFHNLVCMKLNNVDNDPERRADFAAFAAAHQQDLPPTEERPASEAPQTDSPVSQEF